MYIPVAVFKSNYPNEMKLFNIAFTICQAKRKSKKKIRKEKPKEKMLKIQRTLKRDLSQFQTEAGKYYIRDFT